VCPNDTIETNDAAENVTEELTRAAAAAFFGEPGTEVERRRMGRRAAESDSESGFGKNL
jgi:hypothetical protein